MEIGVYVYDIVIVIGILLFIIALINFSVAFALFLAIYPIIYKVPVIEGLEYLPADRIIISMLFIVAIVKIIPYWKKIPFKSIMYTYAIYFATLFISAMASALPWEAFTRTLTYLIPVMFFACALATVIDDRKGLKYLTRGILVGFAVTCAYGLVEILLQKNYLVDLGIITQDYDWMTDIRLGYGRITSFIGQPIYAALYYLFTIPIIYFIMTYYIRSVISKVIILLLLLLSVICIIYTGSRTGIMGLVIFIGIYYFFHIHELNIIKQLSLGILMIGLFYFIAPEGLFGYNIASLLIDNPGKEAQELMGRIDITFNMLDIAMENIVFGLGPGFVLKMKEASGLFMEVAGMENQYAAVLVDSGIIGFGAYLLFIYTIIKVSVTLKSSKSYLVSAWAKVVLSMISVLVITSFTYGYLESIIFQIIMICLGIEIGVCYLDSLEQFDYGQEAWNLKR